MRFKLIERILIEGKNLEKTFDQYKSKLVNFLRNDYPWESEEELEGRAESSFSFVMQLDPTYQEGGTTTGDFGIWLLNQYIKGNLDRYGNYDQDIEGFVQAEPVENLLNDFIEKKSNLRNKDINSYKTPNDLYQALVEVELSDRQKERKIRKDIRGAKKVGSTANFDIYVPETYEASCALGKGSGWCTADSRTREYYDEYLRQYGGRYYILISKDGKYRYQVHFESDQYSAAGTNPDIGTPNQEEMLDHDELFQQWPELDDFFANETDAFNAQRFLTKYIAHMWGTSDFDFSVDFNELESKYHIHPKFIEDLSSWIYPENIEYRSVANQLLDNTDLTMKIVQSFTDENKKYSNSLNNEDLKKLILSAFITSFKKVRQELIDDSFSDLLIQPNKIWQHEVSIFLTADLITHDFVHQYNIENQMYDLGLDNKQQKIEYLKDLLREEGLISVTPDEFQENSIFLCKTLIAQTARDAPSAHKQFFNNQYACNVFVEEFNRELHQIFKD